MKKLLIIALIVLSGCAGQKDYIAPEDLQLRAVNLYQQVHKCIRPTQNTPLYLSPEKEPNAFLSEDGIVVTEGMFAFDDNTIRFVLAHEIAHEKLSHAQARQGVSWGVTGAMMIVNVVVPGAGLLNHVVNPAITNNYSKKQETEADVAAYRACLCMGMTKEEVIQSLRSIEAATEDGGGFWDKHPSWNDRIKSINEAP